LPAFHIENLLMLASAGLLDRDEWRRQAPTEHVI
jgi:hypothetical protein